jgi:hypothetical protein
MGAFVVETVERQQVSRASAPTACLFKNPLPLDNPRPRRRRRRLARKANDPIRPPLQQTLLPSRLKDGAPYPPLVRQHLLARQVQQGGPSLASSPRGGKGRELAGLAAPSRARRPTWAVPTDASFASPFQLKPTNAGLLAGPSPLLSDHHRTRAPSQDRPMLQPQHLPRVADQETETDVLSFPTPHPALAVWIGTCFIASNEEERKMNLVRAKMDLEPRPRPKSWITCPFPSPPCSFSHGGSVRVSLCNAARSFDQAQQVHRVAGVGRTPVELSRRELGVLQLVC